MRFGLIGCGGIGSLRAAAVARLAGAELVAVADADPLRAEAIAKRHHACAVRDWRSLAAREDVDAVLVSTPPPLHAEMAIEAISRGKHVLCEKPLARNPEECRSIVEAAEHGGRLLATGFNYRFYPAVAKAREILRSGAIGEIDHVRAYCGHPGGREFTHEWVHEEAVTGGGALVDNGIHLIDLTCHFLGEVAEVVGYRTDHVWSFAGCEDNGFALLRSREGKIATLQASWTEWRGYRWAVEVYGSRGCVRASYPPMLTRVVWIDENGARRRRLHWFPRLQVVERLLSYRWTGLQSLVRELDAFVGATRGERTPIALGSDGLRATEVAHAVYRASADGRPVRLPVRMAAAGGARG